MTRRTTLARLLTVLLGMISGCSSERDSHGDASHDGANDATTADAASSADASPTDASVTDAAPADASAPPNTPVATHGALHVSGNRIVDAHDQPVALRGMSLFWSQWAGSFYTAQVVQTLADDWHASVVRAAMGVESGGYLTNPDAERAKVIAVVDAAVAEGIYVIVDWHDHEAIAHQTAARAFFVDMAMRYGNVPNVIFEVFNEPDSETWSAVKTYAEDVIGGIRDTGAQNLVIVGTPTWSQDVDVASADPITSRTNVAYTLHFYAGTHGQPLRDKAALALSRGVALFVTEWGTCEASGNGNVNLTSAQTWLDFLAQNGISAANWSLFDKDEACSALVPNAGATAPWSASELTSSGTFARAAIPEHP